MPFFKGSKELDATNLPRNIYPELPMSGQEVKPNKRAYAMLPMNHEHLLEPGFPGILKRTLEFQIPHQPHQEMFAILSADIQQQKGPEVPGNRRQNEPEEEPAQNSVW
jgi:hypothetical protein